MRSIGVKNRNLVKRLTREELKKATDVFGQTDYNGIESKVIDRLPEKVLNIWEMAYQEIQGLIDDVMTDHSHGLIKL